MRGRRSGPWIGDYFCTKGLYSNAIVVYLLVEAQRNGIASTVPP